MRRTLETKGLARLAIGVLLLVPTACQESNPDFDGPASASASSSADSSGTGSTTSPSPMTTTSGMDGTGSTSLPIDTSDTMPPDTSSSDTAEPTTAGSSSSGGGEGPLYPPCMLDENPVCPRPYEECYDFLEPEFTVCTLPCAQDDECPTPASGDAQPDCAGQNNDQCVLDCSGGATCPDGMECQQVGPGGMFERCLWPS